MGLELVEITMMLEDEFAIDLGDDFWTSRAWDGLGDRWDVQVRDLVVAVDDVIREQHRDVPHDVYLRLQKVLADCLGLEEDEVVPEAWLVNDWNVG